MIYLFRHLLSILLLPFLVVVVVPAWLHNAWAAADSAWGADQPLAGLARLAGLAFMATGFGLFAWPYYLGIAVR